jgi:hypothetical protein
VWTSNEPNWTTGIDDDVVFRFTEDGKNWSEVIEITGHYNTGLDKLARVVDFKDRTWFLWETNDQVDSAGTDMDIVMRSWDGHDLGPVVELTPTDDTMNDHYVQVATDDENMYVTWMKTNFTSGFFVHDIWGRVFDGSEWVTPPMKLSSDAVEDNEHPIVVAGTDGAYFLWETYDTGKFADPTSVVLRRWNPEEGLSPRTIVSSLTSNGRDSKPAALWWNEALYVSWISSDQGITFGEDADLVYRRLTVREGGDMDLEDIVEVSESTDDFADRSPSLVAFDEMLFAVWAVDTNYTDVVPPDILETIGGIFRSPDVCIQALEVPFDKRLNLVYSLGTAIPTANKATTAEVVVEDIEGGPLEDSRVGLRYLRDGADASKSRLKLLNEDGDGVYSTQEMEFPKDGSYSVAIVVNDIDVGTFIVDVIAPPPSFLDRVPTTSLFFMAAGIATGGLLYRAMGRDEMVEELRPAPLDLAPSPTD